MLIWGVHVHIKLSSANKVMPIMSSLLNLYRICWVYRHRPPVVGGKRKGHAGYASNRVMMFQRFCTAGLHIQFETWAEFEGFHPHNQKKTDIIDCINENWLGYDAPPRILGTLGVQDLRGECPTSVSWARSSR